MMPLLLFMTNNAYSLIAIFGSSYFISLVKTTVHTNMYQFPRKY